MNERLRIQLEEKDKAVQGLQRNINNIETRLGERSYDLPENDSARQIREDTDAMHIALRNIAEAVLNDDEAQAEEESDGRMSPSRARYVMYRLTSSVVKVWNKSRKISAIHRSGDVYHAR